MNAATEERRRPQRSSPVVELSNVTKEFALADTLIDKILGTKSTITAVSDVSLEVYEGETFGIVGESGCGKSTLANLITGLHAPTSGTIQINGEVVGSVSSRSKAQLTEVGVVFQNAKSSIDPRFTVEQAIAEPLKTAGWDQQAREERIQELYDLVNLPERYSNRHAHELSGGQAQRVAIARAIATEPRILVLDEPVSALDVSVKGSIINLLMELQEKLGLTYIFISHDLSVVKHIVDRIAVMYLGEIMEIAPASQLFERQAHPYSQALLAAVPDGDPTTSLHETFVLEGDVPSPVDPPDGCVFHTRCPMVEDRCKTEEPPEVRVEEAVSKCHYAEEVYRESGGGLS